MRSRVQVSLPLPTKNQALASTQVLFFYPFSGFTTKFPPPSAAHCSGIGSSRSTDPLAKNSKKSAVRFSPAPLREPLEGAFEGSLFGPSAGVFGGASARRLCGSCWRSLCSAPSGELLGHPWRSFWGASASTLGGACSKPMLGTFWRAFGAPLREPLEGAPLGPLRAPLRAQQKTRPRRTGSTHKH